MKKNITIEGTKQNIEKAMAVLVAMGIVIEDNKEAVVETPKDEPKETKTKSSKKNSTKVDWKALEPKKDEDGYYNWNSWKKCRDKYLKTVGLDFDTVGKVEYEEYQKNVEPFAKKYPYVKKSDRK